MHNDPESEADPLQDMPLTAVVSKFLDDQDWDDRVSIDHVTRCSSLDTFLRVDGQRYQLCIRANEKDECLSLSLYSPFAMPADRMPEAARLFNLVNTRLRYGVVGCLDDGESNAVFCNIAFDVSDAVLSLRQLHVMLDAAVWTLRHFGRAIAAVALADVSALDSWAAHQRRQEIAQGDQTLQ